VNKTDRQRVVLEIVNTNRVSSQERLRSLLLERGIEVTQATLSRDMKELRLVKATGADGVGFYSSPEEWDHTPALASLLPTLFHSADGVAHLLVVRTMKGGAQTVAAAIDWEEWPEVLGTLAGDDTILIILRDPGALQEVKQRLEVMARPD
tara:strand:+ start:305 stop:757 length:453 start_codon:yes stop_codon:yes gene_type:complete